MVSVTQQHFEELASALTEAFLTVEGPLGEAEISFQVEDGEIHTCIANPQALTFGDQTVQALVTSSFMSIVTQETTRFLAERQLLDDDQYIVGLEEVTPHPVN